MQKDFYEKKLYPLQDRIFRKINESRNSFYLTGGTALSRFYLNHRYSDDLDFFVNDDPSFPLQVQLIQDLLSEEFNLSVIKKEERFARFFIESHDINLQLEFINDVPAYLGEIKRFELCNRVDNILNILSNKITAISDRDEPKDFADILFIFNSTPINWEVIFSSSQSKAAGIFPPMIGERVENFEIKKLNILNWIESPDYNKIETLKDKMVNDILGVR